MPDQDPDAISITLSPTQIDDVLRAAARGRAPSISTLIADSLAAPLSGNGNGNGAETDPSKQSTAGPDTTAMRGYMLSETSDPRMSRSLLRGLSLLTGFGPDGGERGIVELADDLGMSPSTAHRYALTLVEIGLLERCPRTRKYRLPRG
jgi:hypothetical protein